MILTTIFSILGIYGFFANNIFLLCLGMFINIVENILEVILKKQKNMLTLFLAIFIGFILSLTGNNTFHCIALCICMEDVIMCLCSIPLYFKFVSANNVIQRYFYANDCYEFGKLIEKWHTLPQFSTIKDRILDLNDFESLQTYTAKIVFLFNLMLDISDKLNYIHQLDNTVKLTNNSFILQIDVEIDKTREKLRKAKEIVNSFEREPYFRVYYEQCKKILHLFYKKMDILDTMNYKIKDITHNGNIPQNILSYSFQSETDELFNITNNLSEALVTFQDIINNNDTTFDYLKKLDNQKYKNIMLEDIS